MSQIKAVLYARVSSKEQFEEGFSIAAQKKLLEDYAIKKGHQIIKEFTDIETAKKAGREQFELMKQYLKDHPDIKVILVEKTDRLYRNFRDYVDLEDMKGLEVHLVKENTVLSEGSNSHEKFIHYIKVGMAKNYVDNLSEETKKGMLQKAEQGIYPSMAPFGYTNDKVDKTIVPVDREAEIVQKIYEWYATGDYTLKELREKAKSEGYLEGLSKYKMSKSTIDKLLKSVFYYGDFVWNGKLYHGSHKPIIDKGLWETVQEVNARKTNQSQGKREKDPFKFSGLITCGHCGCHITAQRQKGKYVYYRCTYGKGKCSQPFIREEELEKQFIEVIRNLHFTDEVMAWMQEALLLSHQDEVEYHHTMIARLQDEYRALQTKIDLIYDDKLEGKISPEFWDRKYQQLSLQQEEIQTSIKLHKNADTSYIQLGIKLMEFAKDGEKLYIKLDITGKRELLSILLSNSTLNGGLLTVVYNPPFDVLSACAKSQIWLPGADSASSRRLLLLASARGCSLPRPSMAAHRAYRARLQPFSSALNVIKFSSL